MNDEKTIVVDAKPSRTDTGIAGLDDILLGGLPGSNVFLVEGEPGTGKTTLGLQFLLAGAARGEPVLYVTLSESEREIREVARSHDWSLDGVCIFEFIAQENGLRPEEQYSAFHPAEIELQDTTQSVLQEVERCRPRRLVLDSLSEIRLLARDPLRYRRQVLALKQFFSTCNCTVMLLDDLSGSPEDQQLRSIAHGVLVMEMLPRDFGIIRRRLRVAKLRGSSFREGYHDYTIARGGVVVFPRLISAEHGGDFLPDTIASGLPELDSLWGGGVQKGSSTLIIGPAGAGKSSLAMVYACAAARCGMAHTFLFDESTRGALRRATDLGLDAQQLRDKGALQVDQVDPAELSPGEFIHRIRDSVEKRGLSLLVIDSLNGLLAAMPGEDYLALHMHELLAYLHYRGVTTLMVLTQSGILGTAMASSVDLSYLADNMLLLRYFEASGQVRKAVSVVKKRTGEHEPTIRELSFEGSRITIGAPLTEFRGILTGVPLYSGPVTGLQGGKS